MRLIDADEFFKNFPELAIEPYIDAPTVDITETISKFRQTAYLNGYETGYTKGFNLGKGELYSDE